MTVLKMVERESNGTLTAVNNTYCGLHKNDDDHGDCYATPTPSLAVLERDSKESSSTDTNQNFKRNLNKVLFQQQQQQQLQKNFRCTDTINCNSYTERKVGSNNNSNQNNHHKSFSTNRTLTKNKEKTVRFLEDLEICAIVDTIHVHDMSDEEVYATWWTRREYRAMRCEQEELIRAAVMLRGENANSTCSSVSTTTSKNPTKSPNKNSVSKNKSISAKKAAARALLASNSIRGLECRIDDYGKIIFDIILNAKLAVFNEQDLQIMLRDTNTNNDDCCDEKNCKKINTVNTSIENACSEMNCINQDNTGNSCKKDRERLCGDWYNAEDIRSAYAQETEPAAEIARQNAIKDRESIEEYLISPASTCPAKTIANFNSCRTEKRKPRSTSETVDAQDVDIACPPIVRSSVLKKPRSSRKKRNGVVSCAGKESNSKLMTHPQSLTQTTSVEDMSQAPSSLPRRSSSIKEHKEQNYQERLTENQDERLLQQRRQLHQQRRNSTGEMNSQRIHGVVDPVEILRSTKRVSDEKHKEGLQQKELPEQEEQHKAPSRINKKDDVASQTPNSSIFSRNLEGKVSTTHCVNLKDQNKCDRRILRHRFERRHSTGSTDPNCVTNLHDQPSIIPVTEKYDPFEEFFLSKIEQGIVANKFTKLQKPLSDNPFDKRLPTILSPPPRHQRFTKLKNHLRGHRRSVSPLKPSSPMEVVLPKDHDTPLSNSVGAKTHSRNWMKHLIKTIPSPSEASDDSISLEHQSISFSSDLKKKHNVEIVNQTSNAQHSSILSTVSLRNRFGKSPKNKEKTFLDTTTMVDNEVPSNSTVRLDPKIAATKVRHDETKLVLPFLEPLEHCDQESKDIMVEVDALVTENNTTNRGYLNSVLFALNNITPSQPTEILDEQQRKEQENQFVVGCNASVDLIEWCRIPFVMSDRPESCSDGGNMKEVDNVPAETTSQNSTRKKSPKCAPHFENSMENNHTSTSSRSSIVGRFLYRNSSISSEISSLAYVAPSKTTTRSIKLEIADKSYENYLPKTRKDSIYRRHTLDMTESNVSMRDIYSKSGGVMLQNLDKQTSRVDGSCIGFSKRSRRLSMDSAFLTTTMMSPGVLKPIDAVSKGGSEEKIHPPRGQETKQDDPLPTDNKRASAFSMLRRNSLSKIPNQDRRSSLLLTPYQGNSISSRKGLKSKTSRFIPNSSTTSDQFDLSVTECTDTSISPKNLNPSPISSATSGPSNLTRKLSQASLGKPIDGIEDEIMFDFGKLLPPLSPVGYPNDRCTPSSSWLVSKDWSKPRNIGKTYTTGNPDVQGYNGINETNMVQDTLTSGTKDIMKSFAPSKCNTSAAGDESNDTCYKQNENDLPQACGSSTRKEMTAVSGMINVRKLTRRLSNISMKLDESKMGQIEI